MSQKKSHDIPAEIPGPGVTSRRVDVIFKGILLLGTLAIYAKTLGFAFLNWDDDRNIVKNVALLGGDLAVFWREAYYGLYVPVTYTLWGAIAAISSSAWIFHAANLALHAANAWLVYRWIARRLEAESPWAKGAAAAGAMLFAFHPLQVGAVAWISGFRDLLSALLSLLALEWFWERRSGKGYAVATAFFVAAFLAKPSVIVLPVAIAGLVAVLEPRRLKDSVVRLLPWLAMATPIPVLTHLSQKNYGITPIVEYADRPWVAIDALGFYLRKLALPWDLGPDYGRTPAWVIENQAYLTTGAVLLGALALVGAALSLKKLPRAASGGLLFALVSLVPVLGFVPFAYQYTSTVADHYLYLPLAGLGLALAAILARLPPGSPRAKGWGTGSVCAGLVVLASLSFFQTGIWADDRAFFHRMLEQNPRSFHAHISLGNLEFTAGNFEVALEHYQKASEISPINAAASSNTIVTLGRLGRFQDIIDRIGPQLADPARILWTAETAQYYTVIYYILGAAQGRLGQLESARLSLCRALEINPRNADAATEFEQLRGVYRKKNQRELAPCVPEKWGSTL